MNDSRRVTCRTLAELDARAICVIKPSSLGDIVQSLPVLPALRARFPAARISWIAKREFAELLAGHPDLDEVITVDTRGGWREWLRLLTDLRGRCFDLVIDLQGLLRTGLMTWCTGAPLRIGLETAREGSWAAYHARLLDTGPTVPAHVRYWRVAEALGAGSLRCGPAVGIREEDRQWARRHVAPLGGLSLAIHPGARWSTKRWPVEKFAAIARRALAEHEASVVLVGGSAERDLGCRLQSLLAGQDPRWRVENLMGQSTLKQLSALLAQVDLLVTTDSGPMHLAAALQTPVLGVFTCTSPVLSGPPGDAHELVTTNVQCAACYRKRCPHRGRRRLCCHEELDVERVWNAFQRLLAKNDFTQRAA